MKFQHIKLDSFGPLDESISLSEDRINLFLAPNEAGKSSLVRAITGVLYGLVSDRRKATNPENLTERDFFRPWNGDEYRVHLEVTHTDGSLKITRNFSEETVSVFDRDTGKDITEQYVTGDGDESIGKSLTSLSRSAFEKSVLVQQKDVELDEDRNDLVTAIQKMADTADGQTTAREALENLDEATRNFQGQEVQQGKLETEQERVRNRIDELEEEMEQLRSKWSDAEEKIKRAEQLKEEIEDIEDELDRVDFLETVARKRELEEKLEKNRKRREKLDELEEELEDLKEYESFPHGQHENVLRAHEKRNQKLDDLEKVKEKKTEKEEELQKIESRLEEMEGLQKLDLEEVEELMEFCESGIHYAREIEEAEKECEDEMENMEDPETLKQDHDRLNAIFNELTPADREFLNDMNQKLRSISDQEAEYEREISDAKEKVSEVDRERRRKRIRFGIYAGGAGLLSLGGFLSVFFTEIPALAGYAAAGAGVAGAAFAIFWWFKAGHHRADERSEWMVKLKNLSQRQSEQIQERRKIQKRSTTIAGKLGLEGTEELLDKYEEYRSLYSRLEDLLQLEAQQRREEKKLENIIQQYAPLLDQADHTLNKNAGPEEFDGFLDRLKRYRKNVEEKASVEARLADLKAEINKIEREMESQENQLTSILDQAGISVEGSIDEAVEEFKSRYQKYHRLQSITERIPEVKDNLLPDDELEESQRMYEQLKTHLETIRENRPDMETPDQVAAKEEYSQRRKTLRNKKESLIADRADLEREVGTIESRYRQQYPKLREEKERLQRYNRQLIQLREAVGLARGVLEEISDDVHAEWARVLNERTSGYIEKIAPGYRNLRFDSDLRFTITAEDREQPLSPSEVKSTLSSGARDQIFLAVRLGLGTFLSGKTESLPVIFDESFAHYDDQRFQNALELLTDEILPENQVIYFTCHRSRISWLKEEHPDWFENFFRIISLEDTVRTK